MSSPNWISTKEAAQRLGYAPEYVARLCRQGDLGCRRDGETWLVEEQSLKTYETLVLQKKELKAKTLSRELRRESRAAAVVVPVVAATVAIPALAPAAARAVAKGWISVPLVAASIGVALLAGSLFLLPVMQTPAPTTSSDVAGATATSTRDLAELYKLIASSTSKTQSVPVVQNIFPIRERIVESAIPAEPAAPADTSAFVTYDFLSRQIDSVVSHFHGGSNSGGSVSFDDLTAADIPDLSASYLSLSGGTVTGTTTTQNLAIASLDCSGLGNGGKLTTDAAGTVVCGGDNGSGGTAWGDITGTLANQTDLQNALNVKLNTSDFGAQLGTFDKGYFFSTTSAAYNLSTIDKGYFFSTTSANYLLSTKNFSTFAYPFPSNATSTSIAFNGGLTAPSATIAYASTTALSATTLCLATDCRTTWPTAGSSFAYPFPSNATSTSIAFNGGLSGILTGSLIGNASTATALQTGRTINGVTFDGTSNIVIAAASSTLLADSNTFSGNNTFSAPITGSITGNAGTVTNGVYTTTFNSLFDPRFVTDLAATSSIASITTLPNLSLPYSQLTGVPAGFAYPFPGNATTTQIAFNGGLTATTLSAATSASLASTTLTGNTLLANATSTTFAITSIASSLLKTTANGSVVAAVAGTDYQAAGNYATFAYPFPGNATSTNITFSGGLTGALTGNASTAAALQTGRTINGVIFDGTTNIVIAAASSTLLADSNTFSGTNTFTTAINGSITGNAGTVTNGVYTTTFGTLFDNRLSASSSIAGIITLPNLSLPYSQLTGVPNFATFAYPFPNNATSTTLTFSGGIVANASSTIGTLNLVNALTVPNGGTGSTTLGGLLTGNGTGAVTSAAVSGPLSFVGNTLSITQSGTGSNGYLSSTDFNTFNNKISSTSLSSANGYLTFNSSTGVFTASTTPTYVSATTTNFGITGVPNALLKTVNGVVTAAVAGTDYLTSATTFAYPFPNNATSTLLSFNGGLTAYASSTLGNGTATGGLTVSGGATTTGTAYFAGKVGIGTSAPGADLHIQKLFGATLSIESAVDVSTISLYGDLTGSGSNHSISFFDGTSVSGAQIGNISVGVTGMALGTSNATKLTFNTAGSARLTVDAAGNVGIGNTSPTYKLDVTGLGHFTGLVDAANFIATSTTLASRFTYASTTVLSATTICLSTDCRTSWPTGSAYPFALAGNATSTLTQFNGGLTAYASTTIGNGTATGGLTISGNATTTGIAYFAGQIGIGTSSPSGTLAIRATAPSIILNASGNSTAWQIGGAMLGSSGGLGFSGTNSYTGDPFHNPILFLATPPSSNPSTGEVYIGTTTNIAANNSRLFIFGGAAGANVDAMGDATVVGGDQAVFEAEGSDYNLSKSSIAIQYYGPTNAFGSTLGYANKRLGILDFGSASTSIISTGINTAGGDNDLIFGTGYIQRAVLSGAGNLGIGTTTPGSLLSVGNTNGINFSTATSTFSSTGGINLASGCFAIRGTCLSAGGGSSLAYPFALAGNATSTLTQFNGGLTAYASTTIGNGTATGGLTVSGGATTTGNAYFAGNVGIGAAPLFKFDVRPMVGGRAAFRASTDFYAATVGTVIQGTDDTGGGYTVLGLESSKLILNGLSGGTVSIGTTTTSSKLTVDGGFSAEFPAAFLGGVVVGNYRYTGLAIGQQAAAGYGANIGYMTHQSNTALSGTYITNYGDSEGTTGIFVQRGGNVGIGTTSPNALLTIQSSSSSIPPALDLWNDIGAHGYIQMGRSGNTLVGGKLVLDNLNGTGIILGSAANNVGIGTTSPLQMLHVDRNQNAPTYTAISNANGGTGALAGLQIYNDGGNSSASALRLITLGNNFTTAGPFIQDSGILDADSSLSGGLSFVARAAAGVMRFYTGGDNERMRIDASGNVGIGTTSPGVALDIGGAAPYARLWSSSAGGDAANLYRDGSNAGWAAGLLGATGCGSGQYAISNGTCRMVISAAGNVGIGTTTPDAQLTLNKANSATVDKLKLKGGNSDSFYWLTVQEDFYNPGAGNMRWNFNTNDFASGSKTVMSLLANGNVGIGTTNGVSKLTLGNNVYTAPLGSSYDQYQLLLYDAGTAAGSYGLGIEGFNIGFNSGGGYKFYQAGGSTPLMYIGGSSSTNVGIGVSPSFKLDVAGDTNLSSGSVFRINSASVLSGSTLGSGVTASSLTSVGTITSGTWTGTAIAVANGGTGATTAANARTNLGVTATGADTTYAFRSNNLSDLANAGTARSNLGLGTIATLSATSPTFTTDARAPRWYDSDNTGFYADPAGTSQLSTVFVNGQLRVDNGVIARSTTAYPGSDLGLYSGVAGNFMRFVTNASDFAWSTDNSASADKMHLTSGGTLSCTSGCTNGISDQRLKTNIQPLGEQGGLAALELLNPVSFNWKDTNMSSSMQFGFIAQDIEKVFPNLVGTYGTSSITLADGSTQTLFDTKDLNMTGIIPVAVKAIQELNLNLEAIASTSATSTPESVSFATAFWASVKGQVGAWLADAGNGISNIFAQTVTASVVHAQDVKASNTVCIGTECFTEGDVRALLDIVHGQGSGSGAGDDVGGGSGSGGDTGTTTPPVDPGPEASSTPPQETPPADTPPADSSTTTPETP